MMKISLSLVAIDKMSRVIKEAVSKSDEAFTQMQNKIKKVSEGLDKVGKAAMVAGGIVLTLCAANLKLAADFETGMASVSTLIDTNVESLAEMNKEVLNIAKRTPVALNDLTSSLYDIRSAGISANDQFVVLEKSAQLGVAGLGTTSEAVDLVTSSLNAFQLKGNDATRVYDTIFKTVKFGKTTISGLAQGFGAVAGTVSASNIKLDDYLAAVAALTTTGQPAAQAHHQLKAAIAGMTRESEESVAVFKALGVKNFKELIQKSGGMVNAFSRITNQVKNNDAAILKLFGSTEAYNSVVGLTSKQHQTYVETLNAMRNGPSLVDEGYLKKLDTINAQMQRFQNFMQKIGIDMGTALMPYVRRFLDFVEKIMDVFDRMPDKFKNKLSVGLAGIGIALTTFGIASIAIGKMMSGYGKFLGYLRELSPVLIGKSASLLQNIGLNGAAHNLTYGLKIRQTGNPLGLDMKNFSLKNGLFSDIKRIDKNMRRGIINGFKELPGNISKSAVSLKDWTVNSVKAIPENFVKGLKSIKKGFFGIPGMIKKAVIAFRTFSLTLLTSPLGWIAVILVVAALLIYKYWKPITAFFKGTWQGLKEGLEPLMPLFKRMGTALEPVIKPIKAIIDWFKKIIKPVDDTGGAAEKMGVRFGKAIANIILKLVELVAKAFECGGKITSMLAEGIHKGIDKVKKAISAVSQVVRDHLPHSPAKIGPLKDLHKVKIVETIASAIKPMPIMTAMNKSLAFVSGGLKANVRGVKSSTPSIIITYNPTITISGSESKEEFLTMLKKHKDEILNIIRREFERKERLAY
nr:MAG TPA: minor tail protein [Caudoviricetes sp.]